MILPKKPPKTWESQAPLAPAGIWNCVSKGSAYLGCQCWTHKRAANETSPTQKGFAWTKSVQIPTGLGPFLVYLLTPCSYDDILISTVSCLRNTLRWDVAKGSLNSIDPFLKLTRKKNKDIPHHIYYPLRISTMKATCWIGNINWIAPRLLNLINGDALKKGHPDSSGPISANFWWYGTASAPPQKNNSWTYILKMLTPPKTNMDTQNCHIWKEIYTFKNTSFLVSMLVVGRVICNYFFWSIIVPPDVTSLDFPEPRGF